MLKTVEVSYTTTSHHWKGIDMSETNPGFVDRRFVAEIMKWVPGAPCHEVQSRGEGIYPHKPLKVGHLWVCRGALNTPPKDGRGR